MVKRCGTPTFFASVCSEFFYSAAPPHLLPLPDISGHNPSESHWINFLSLTSTKRYAMQTMWPRKELSDALGIQYSFRREIGRGGMSIVYLALDQKHDRQVAVKVLRTELAGTIATDRFRREIALTAALSHPNILPLFDSGEANGVVYFVSPFVDGLSLRDRLEQAGKLPVDEVLRYAADLAAALDYAHGRGVVHRDLKPDNILLAAGRAVIADFGIARALTAASTTILTDTGLAVGTPTYMSPEQALGEPDVGPSSDIFSLGCLLYEALTGSPPFVGSNFQEAVSRRFSGPAVSISEQRSDVPSRIDSAIIRCLAIKPQDRFVSAGELVEALGVKSRQEELNGKVSTHDGAPGLINDRLRSRRSIRIIILVASTLGILVFWRIGPTYYAQIRDRSRLTNPSLNLRMARELYFGGQYDKAIGVLRTISRTQNAPIGVRKDALRYLARSFLGRSQSDSAKEALRELIAFEPPMVLLIPSLETPELIHIYYELRREKSVAVTPLRNGSLKALAVFDFEISSDEKEHASLAGVAQLFGSSMFQSHIPLVERSQFAIDESADTNFYAVEPVGRAGTKVLAASHVLFGSLAYRQGQFLISTWLFDVRTGELNASRQQTAKKDNLLKVIDELADDLAASIKFAVPADSSTTRKSVP